MNKHLNLLNNRLAASVFALTILASAAGSAAAQTLTTLQVRGVVTEITDTYLVIDDQQIDIRALSDSELAQLAGVEEGETITVQYREIDGDFLAVDISGIRPEYTEDDDENGDYRSALEIDSDDDDEDDSTEDEYSLNGN
ncbi:MAG: hypothetical protein SF029_23935 [bacterium]|nr:hypothetical protein [bacterium]